MARPLLMDVGLAVYRQQFAALVGVPRFGDDEHQRATLARVALVNVDDAPSHGDAVVRPHRLVEFVLVAAANEAIALQGQLPVVADGEREVADRRPPQFLRRGISDLAADPCLELVRDPRTHAASRTATTSTAICASDCTSLSQITPVAAGYGAANTSRLTSAVRRYAASPAGVTNSVVFTTASSPLPSVARSLPIRA